MIQFQPHFLILSGNMKNILKIKDQYWNMGITNTYLAEKAGITPADLFELDEKHIHNKKVLIERVAAILEVDSGKLALPCSLRNNHEKSVF